MLEKTEINKSMDDDFYLIHKDRVKTLHVLHTFSHEVPEEYRDEYILRMLGRELALKLIEYKEILFIQTEDKEFIEIRINLDIIVPRNNKGEKKRR